MSLAKKPSTALSQDAEVGVKWNVQRGDAGPAIFAPWDVCGSRSCRRQRESVNQDDVDRGIAQVLDQVQTSETTAHYHHALPLRGRYGGLDRWSHLRTLVL
jgi:hypothetical protein